MKATLVTAALAAITPLALAGRADAQEFNGPYAGVAAGWEQNKVGDRKVGAAAVAVDRSRDSFAAGLFGGYDRQINDRWVVGGEAGLYFGSDDKITRRTATRVTTVDPKYSFDLSARAGYLVTPETLAYVRAGYVNARVRTTLVTPTGATRRSGSEDGWMLGGGVERKVFSKISARLEYRYSDLSGDLERHQVLAGVAYRF